MTKKDTTPGGVVSRIPEKSALAVQRQSFVHLLTGGDAVSLAQFNGCTVAQRVAEGNMHRRFSGLILYNALN